MRSDNPVLAVTYSLIAALLYALIGLIIKALGQNIPTAMIVFFQQAFSFALLVPVLSFELSSFKQLQSKCFHLHLLRAFSSLAALYCFYFALKYLPLVDVLLLTYTRPLFIPIVVFLWFKKKWTKKTFLGLFVGFLGVILILKPSEKVFDIAALIGLASGLFGAIAFTTIRRLTKTEFANQIIFYYLALSIPFSSLPLVEGWQPLTLKTIVILFLIGVISVFYQMSLTRAYRHAKAFQIGSLLYSTVIFGAIFDGVFLKDLSLGISSIVGMILIFLGSLFVMRSSVSKISHEKNNLKK